MGLLSRRGAGFARLLSRGYEGVGGEVYPGEPPGGVLGSGKRVLGQSRFVPPTAWTAAVGVLARAGASCTSNDPRLPPSKIARLLAGAADVAGVFVRLPTDVRVVPGRFVRRYRGRWEVDVPNEQEEGGFTPHRLADEDVGVVCWPGEADPKRPLTWCGAADRSTRRALRDLEIQLGIAPPVSLAAMSETPVAKGAEDDLVTEIESLVYGIGLKAAVYEGGLNFERLDLSVDPELRQSYERLTNDLLAAVLGDPGLVRPGRGSGQASRERRRLFLQRVVAPLVEVIEAEARRVLSAPSLTLAVEPEGPLELLNRARSLQARAKAVFDLVEAGVPRDRALALVGLEEEVSEA
ncbi:MAG: hypothetical protein OXT63_06250 [Gemmatimonadota bacterium]|nr:hypothetical protein [Gemmatimonadota bacterium]